MVFFDLREDSHSGVTKGKRFRWGRTAGTLGLLAAIGVFPQSARADIANGIAEFLSDVTASFDLARFPTGNFAITDGGSSGAGNLYSTTNHGPLDDKQFPASPDYLRSTQSVGDSETTSNRVEYGYASILPSVIWIKGPGTQSDSQAASLGASLHLAGSNADTTVFQHLTVKRKEGTGIVEPPRFNVRIWARDHAVHLKAIKEGNADALAEVRVYLAGQIKNLNVPGQDFATLNGVEVLGKSVLANDEWYSTAFENNYSLALPEWTRISGANFELKLGLQLKMFTYAEVVPEPGTLLILAVGTLSVIRRRSSVSSSHRA